MILEDVSFQPDSCYLDRGYKFFYQKSKNFRLTRCQKYKKINKAGGPIDYKLGPYEVIAGKKIHMTEEEARDLAKRALKFKEDRGRLPEITSADPWEKRMAEGIEYLRQKVSKETV